MSNINKIKQAVTDWKPVLQAFGINELYLTGESTSCPSCGGVDRFTWSDKKKLGFCRGCYPNSKDGIQLIKEMNNFTTAEAINELLEYLGLTPEKIDNSKFIRRKEFLEYRKQYIYFLIFDSAREKGYDITVDEFHRAKQAMKYLDDIETKYKMASGEILAEIKNGV